MLISFEEEKNAIMTYVRKKSFGREGRPSVQIVLVSFN